MAEPAHQKFILKVLDIILERVLSKKDETNTENSNSSYTKKILLIIFCVIFIDYQLKITENIMIGSKVDKISEIQNVVQHKSLDSLTRKTLIYDQRMIANRHSWQFGFDDFMSFIQRTINSPMEINSIPINNATIYRSNFWHILTSAWIFIAVGIVSFFFILFQKGIKVLDKLFLCLILSLFFTFSIIGISYLFAQIPLLKYPIINYIVNVILNAVVVFCLVKIGENAEKKGYLSKLNL